jgi:hypothetical protein
MKFAIPRPPTITVDAIVEGEERCGDINDDGQTRTKELDGAGACELVAPRRPFPESGAWGIVISFTVEHRAS